jgi:hypothetical protein
MPPLPSLPFVWDKHFVKGESGDCVPSCVSMAALYWKSRMPDLPVPSDPEEWRRFVLKTSDVSYRGTSLRRLMRNMPSTVSEPALNESKPDQQGGSQLSDFPADQEEPPTLEPIETNGLVMDPRQLRESSDLESLLASDPPIPAILVLDIGLAQYNKKWGSHAVLLHSLDARTQRKIYLIDPMLEDLREPFTMDLRRFEIGWAPHLNTAILIYPKAPEIRITSSKRDYMKLTVFMEEPKTD